MAAQVSPRLRTGTDRGENLMASATQKSTAYAPTPATKDSSSPADQLKPKVDRKLHDSALRATPSPTGEHISGSAVDDESGGLLETSGMTPNILRLIRKPQKFHSVMALSLAIPLVILGITALLSPGAVFKNLVLSTAFLIGSSAIISAILNGWDRQ